MQRFSKNATISSSQVPSSTSRYPDFMFRMYVSGRREVNDSQDLSEGTKVTLWKDSLAFLSLPASR